MVHRTQSKLIALDANRQALAEVARIARPWYDVLSTGNPRQAKTWLNEQTDIAVFVTDLETQKFEGTSLLEDVQTQFPGVRRIVLTSYSDLGLLIQGLHNGAIQKLVEKPIDGTELMAAIVPFEAQAGVLWMPTRLVSDAG